MAGYSSNTNLLPLANISFAGSGGTRTVSLWPNPNMTGVSVVSIVVSDDEGLSTTNHFNFQVGYFSPLTSTIPITESTPRWADYDNDGDLDLYAGGKIYRNDGNLIFVVVATLEIAWRNGADWGDYDRDGDLDLVVANSSGTRIYRNNGNSTFTDIGAGLAGTSAETAAWGDYDNDGKLDLVIAGGWDQSAQSFTWLYHNDGGTFSQITNSGLSKMAMSAVTWGDLDRDGYLDIVINGLVGGSPTAWRTDVYRNKGNGTFTNLNAGLFGVREGNVSLGDYDNDGFLDILTAGFNFGSYVLYIYHNNGNNTFTEVSSNLQGEAFGDAQWVDYNNDGFLDVFVQGCAANYCDARVTTIYQSVNGTGAFTNINTGLSVTSAGSASWGDFDKDGDLDLFLAGLYRNNCPVSNSPPTTPTGLSSVLIGDNAVRLNWTKPSDAETTNAAGLSYALEISSPTLAPLYFASHADVATGSRRVPQRGRVNTNTLVLPDVPTGNYFWRVQAIDSGLAGSAFSTAGTFTITNARPTISSIPNQTTVPNRATGPIPFTVADKETAAGSLTLTGGSSDALIVAANNISFGGSGSNRTVNVTPVNGRSGTVTISVVVFDGSSLSSTTKFDVVVQTFTSVPNAFGTGADGVNAWGDFDNDGDLDAAMSIPAQSYTRIYTNSGGIFGSAVTGLPMRTQNSFAWVDYDRDGDLDLSEIGWNGGYTPTTYVYRNNGGNSFTSLSNLGFTNVADGAIAWGDFDNDGDADAFVSGDPDTYHTPNGAAGLFRNDGGTFTNTGIILPQIVNGTAAWGDLDRDGDLDLILAGQTNSYSTSAVTKIFLNNGNSTFTTAATSIPAFFRGSLALADCDKDGDLDVAYSGLATNTNRIAGVYFNNGTGTFTNSGASVLGVGDATVAWGDYDSDGLVDLVLSGGTNDFNTSATTKVYRNTGSAFTDLGGSLPGGLITKASWGDYDNDGDLDILLGSNLLKNNYNQSNTPPPAPTNLAATRLPNRDMWLSWNKPVDSQSGSNGLTYNLRIGTTPGGSQIMASESDLITGKRRLPQLGNAGTTNGWRVRLPFGTYYWSVQAVDGGFIGSPFSTEGSFVVTNRPPVAWTTESYIGEDATWSFNLVGTDPDGDALTYAISASPTNGTLTGTAPALTYRPATNFFGTDTFQFNVNDGLTNSASALVTIHVNQVDDVPSTSVSLSRGTNSLKLSVTGEPRQVYGVEVSTNLIQWDEITTLQCNATNGQAIFTESDWSSPGRFYRLHVKP